MGAETNDNEPNAGNMSQGLMLELVDEKKDERRCNLFGKKTSLIFVVTTKYH